MMKAVVLILLSIVTLSFALPAIDVSVIKKVNSVQRSWVAGANDYFKTFTREDAKRLMGWKKDPNRPPLAIKHNEITALPTNFDSTTQWPTCKTIGQIFDQARCG
jgi:hypothetical protein